MEINNIYCKDCIKGMKELPDDSVTISVTSPPYLAGNDIDAGVKSKYQGFNDNLGEEEYYNLIKDSLTEAIRVTKYYVFLNFQILSGTKNVWNRIMWDFRHNIKEYFIWAKTHSPPSICEGVVSSGFEFIICFTKPELAKNRKFDYHFWNNRKKNAKTVRNVFIKPQFRSNKNTIHRAQFDTWLPEFFIKHFTKEGDLVLDYFSGLGTTAKVAKQMGRNYLGFDLVQKYVDFSKKELENINFKGEGLEKWF